MTRFIDFGDAGTYSGDLDTNGKRHGVGKMVYDNGSTYEGGFVNDKFECDRGVYKWADGDEQESQWKAGERNGKSIFRAINGDVEYSMYVNGEADGMGVSWSADRKTAYKVINGQKQAEISLAMAEKIARDTFDLPVPEPSQIQMKVGKVKAQNTGILGRLFSSKKVDADGNPRFKDHGDWGSYIGELDPSGSRNGKGKMIYDSGCVFDGFFTNDKYDKQGLYKWPDGDEYEGEWVEGDRHGKGIFRSADGTVEYSMYEKGAAVGEGIAWNATRTTIHRLVNGTKTLEILAEEANKLAHEKFDWSAPEVAKELPPTVINSNKRVGFFQKLFYGGPRYDENGKLMFKDNGDWGSWSGDLDTDMKRTGRGTMTYESGSIYKGSFVDDKYDDDGEGIYSWYDGEEYAGQWKAGERHGKGIFRSADGGVEYSMYERGTTIGEGVSWSADRKVSHRLLDGIKVAEISLGVAQKIATEKFDLPVPEIADAFSPKASSKATQPGLLKWLFSGAPPVDDEGKPMYKDNGDWGSYDGERDTDGNRQGKGKMTYKSGAVYEGGFSNNKYEDDQLGKYLWSDGDEYIGQWKAGERHGKGIFRSADGLVGYSMYDKGVAIGEGIMWSADRQSAHKLVNGEKSMEMLVEEAEIFSKEKFDFPIPEISKVTSAKASTVTPVGATKRNSSLLQRLFTKYDADGNVMHKDNGEWGSWKGNLDANGKRTGEGKMIYESGCSYEGSFFDDKYEGSGKYVWPDKDEYDGQWKLGERNGKGIFRSSDGIVEYSMYKDGAAVGEGISWSADRKVTHKLMNGEKTIEILAEEAESIAREKFDLPVPTLTAVITTQSDSHHKNSGLLGWFKSSNTVSPNDTTPNSYAAVEEWLSNILPSLNMTDMKAYCKHLADDGFDSPEMLDQLLVDDLSFMKKAHQRVLVEKLEGKKNIAK